MTSFGLGTRSLPAGVKATSFCLLSAGSGRSPGPFLQALQHNGDGRALDAHFLFKLALVDLAIRLLGQEVDSVDRHPGQGKLGGDLLRLADALGRFFDDLAAEFNFFQVSAPFVSSLTNIRGQDLLDV